MAEKDCTEVGLAEKSESAAGEEISKECRRCCMSEDIICELNELIIEFTSKIRFEVRFPEEIYNKIINIIKSLVDRWKYEDVVPKKVFMLILDFALALTSSGRYLSKEALKVRDANLELRDLLYDLLNE